MSEPAISVVLAAYHGERYIQKQLESVVGQLRQEDELVVSIDDASPTDQTWAIVQAFAASHREVKIVCLKGPNQGVISNFEYGLSQAQNPLVLLCDQDDVWLDNKVEVIRKAFQKNEKLMGLVHDCALCDEKLEIIEPSFFAFHHSKNGLISNLVRNSCIGCCMAIRKEVINASLPFPKIPMHDQFLGLQAMRLGEVLFLPEVLSLYRRHDQNLSKLKPASIANQVKWRAQLLQALAKRPIQSKSSR